MINETKILQELDKIKDDLKQIKEHMVDIDSIMTEEDYKILLDYRQEKKLGKLISHETLRKELKL